MSDIKDGGPAFPSMSLTDSSIPNPACKAGGMTLRDYFAAKAMQGFMANTKRPTTLAKDDANWFYQIADAMLAERVK